jgi:xanthine dehydrogenase YagR molybdenum-binding subunit
VTELSPLNILGRPENHDPHGLHIVTGKADFAGDRLPGVKLYGALALATIAHGTITSIDTSAALAEPGVKAVITSADCPIWIDTIYAWGQEVAGVVADDLNTAIRAARLIKVEYKTSAFAFDPDEAAKANSTLSDVLPGTNTRLVTNLKRGDVNSGMARAEVTLQTEQPWSNSHQHNTIEPHQAVAWWVGDHAYFWTPSQHIYNAKNTFINTLGIPGNKVHAFTHFTGCALGDKNSANAAVIAAVMSRAAGGAPVHFIESRHDNVLVNSRQFAVRSSIKLGANRDGTLTAIDASFLGDGGRNAAAPVANVHFGLRTTYLCTDASFQVTVVNTNTPPRGFWRCVNDPPGAVNYDVALDKLADKLGMDPYQLRRKNLRPFDAPDQDAPYLVWGGTALEKCFDWVAQSSDYTNKYHRPGIKILTDGRLHGLAITGHIDSHGTVSGAMRGATVLMTPDGRALLNMGGARGSDGGPSVCCHIVAEVLGMSYEDVGVGEWGNTDVTLDAGMQAGSTFTPSAGSAFFNAATDLRNKVFAFAVTQPPFRGLDPSKLDAQNSQVFLKSDPAVKATFRQVMSMAPPTAGVGNGWSPTLRSRAVGAVQPGSTCNSNGDSATCAEVAVDPETGEVEILGLWNAVDTGRTVFKQGTLKEMYSGTELIIGQALYYGDVYDKDSGAVLSTSYVDALFPTTLDFDSERVYVQDIESDDASGPFGAHGIGEPCVSNYSAVICAIFNATGKWVDTDKGACTPDKVLKALGKG